MSTKIYSAYRYHRTIEQLLIDLKFLRKKDYYPAVKKHISQIAKARGLSTEELRTAVTHDMDLLYPSISDDFAFNGAAVIYPFEGKIFFQVFGLDEFAPLKKTCLALTHGLNAAA